MKLFTKCMLLFIILAVLFTLLGQLLINLNPLPVTILVASILSLMITIIYGWVDGVYIHPTPG